jgi:hypothetical protein
MSLVLTHLEARLAAPDGVLLRDELVRHAMVLEQNARARMSSGLPRQDFPTWQSVAEAATAAREVLAAWPVADTTSPAGASASALTPFPSR